MRVEKEVCGGSWEVARKAQLEVVWAPLGVAGMILQLGLLACLLLFPPLSRGLDALLQES